MTPEDYHSDLLAILDLAIANVHDAAQQALLVNDRNAYLLGTMPKLHAYLKLKDVAPIMVADPSWFGDVTVQDPQQLKLLDKSAMLYYKAAGCTETAAIHPRVSLYARNAMQLLDSLEPSIMQNLVQRNPLPPQMQNHEQNVVAHESNICCGNASHTSKIVTNEHMVCVQCGQVVPDTQQLVASFAENTKPNQKVTAPYNRISAWFEMVNRIQGLRVSDISAEQWEKIYGWITQGFADVSTIPFSHVHEVLKNRKLHKLYKDAPGIWSHITGNIIPPIDPVALRTIWEDIVVPINANFDAIKQRIDPQRTNFFSNPFLLYKTFELCGLKEYLPFIKLLKGEEKLRKTFDLWKEHCRILNMKYYPNHLY